MGAYEIHLLTNMLKNGLMGRQVDSQVTTRTPVFTQERGALYVGAKVMLSCLLYLVASFGFEFDPLGPLALPSTRTRMDERHNFGNSGIGYCVFLSSPRPNESRDSYVLVRVCGGVCSLYSLPRV